MKEETTKYYSLINYQNYFPFNDKIYTENSGLAMGT
jgi:hypothetical protein